MKDTLNKVVKKDCLDIIELDKVDDSEAILEYLKKLTGARSVSLMVFSLCIVYNPLQKPNKKPTISICPKEFVLRFSV